LDDLCQLHYGLPLKSVTGNIDTARLKEISLDTVLLYNGLDAKYHRKLYHTQRKLLKAEGLETAYEAARRRVAPAVAIQLKGVPLNQALISQNEEEYKKKIADIESQIAALPEVVRYKKSRGA